MIKIGLTGNIASGKSLAEAIIEDFGYKTLDLDKVSHKLINTTCKSEIIKTFGSNDRAELAKIVFKDKEKLKKLENIIYPKIKDYILDYFKENSKEKIVVISGAQIFEAGFSHLFDKIIFIDADKKIRLKRLIARNSLDEKTALIRINAQNDNFKNKADFIVENNENEIAFKEKILELMRTLAQ